MNVPTKVSGQHNHTEHTEERENERIHRSGVKIRDRGRRRNKTFVYIHVLCVFFSLCHFLSGSFSHSLVIASISPPTTATVSRAEHQLLLVATELQRNLQWQKSFVAANRCPHHHRRRTSLVCMCEIRPRPSILLQNPIRRITVALATLNFSIFDDGYRKLCARKEESTRHGVSSERWIKNIRKKKKTESFCYFSKQFSWIASAMYIWTFTLKYIFPKIYQILFCLSIRAAQKYFWCFSLVLFGAADHLRKISASQTSRSKFDFFLIKKLETNLTGFFFIYFSTLSEYTEFVQFSNSSLIKNFAKNLRWKWAWDPQ